MRIPVFITFSYENYKNNDTGENAICSSSAGGQTNLISPPLFKTYWFLKKSVSEQTFQGSFKQRGWGLGLSFYQLMKNG